MRVALVCPFDPDPPQSSPQGAHVGGVERVFREVSRGLAARGHDVTVVCSSDGPLPSANGRKVRFVREPRRATVLRAPIARLARHLSDAYDVVHVAATYPFITSAVLRRAHRLGIPSVLDFHFEPDPGSPAGRLAAWVYGRLGTRAYQLADLAIVRSMAYGRSAPSLAQVPEERWRVVPNGIDPTRFHPDGLVDASYLLFVGRLVPYKGLPVLLRALPDVRDCPPLWIVGDGPERGRLEAMARRLALRVRFMGHVADGALPDLYRGARLAVLPSVTRQEAFGVSLLESMACGTPVVASELPGVAELALKGGLVAPPGDSAALAEAITAALKPGHLPRGKALAGPIAAEYSWDAVTRRLEAVYEEAIGRHGRPAIQSEVMTSADSRGHPLL